MKKVVFSLVCIAVLFAGISCEKAPTQTEPTEDVTLSIVDYQEFNHPVSITTSDLQEVREEAYPDGSRMRVRIKPPHPNSNHWPINNIPQGFIVIQLDGVTGQHVYYIHESVVPEEGIEFAMIEQVYYLSDGSVVGGLEFSPHGTFFTDHTYLYWDFSYLYEEPPADLDLLYWAGEGDESWLVDLHRELEPQENRRVEFTIDHFSIYAIRRSTLPKPPPPSMIFMY